MPYVKIDHEVEPKEKILSDIGDISGVEVFNRHVLLAVYQRPTKTKSGLYLADRTVEEDRYQSKVGLILKMGEHAFVPDEEHSWGDGEFSLGDWVILPAAAAYSMLVNGVMCRLVPDHNIKMRVSDPDMVY